MYKAKVSKEGEFIVSYMRFVIHVYFKVSLHVFHACQCKWLIGHFV